MSHRMRVLVLGGTQFMGYFLVQRLLASGARVTLFNRGQTPDPFGQRVSRVHGDRRSSDLAKLLGNNDFDAAVDLTAFTADDVKHAIKALTSRVGHYIFISSGQVYLVRQSCPKIAKETDYDGLLMAEPSNPVDHAEWAYGMGKRGCEDVLLEAWSTQLFPSTRLRIPMVNGERDPKRRIERYLVRMMDGAPLILPDGGTHPVRHVYCGDVVKIIMLLLSSSIVTLGEAYNLCQQEMPSLLRLLGTMAQILGARPRLYPVPSTVIHEHGLDPITLSPFSNRWMSVLDPSKAVSELGLKHQPLERYLETIITSFLAHPPSDPLPGYEHREAEIALIKKMGHRESGMA